MRKTMAYGLAVALVAMVFLTMPMSVSAEYTGTVTILSDGTVVPAGAPVSVMGLNYILTDDVAGNIIIQMSGIIFDGAGHTVTGTGGGSGILCIGLTGVTIKDCVVMDFYNGIVLEDCDSCTVKENTATGCVDGGIYLTGSNDNTVKENKLHDNVWEGVWLEYSNNNVIKDNLAWNHGEAGIFLWYSSNNNIIKDNEAWNSATAGILLVIDANDNIITNNKVHDNGVMGIVVQECAGNIVRENTATDNNLGGIWVYYGTTGNTVENNMISGSIWEGIRLYSSGGNMIKGNTIENCRRGILVWFNPVGNGNTVTENTAWKNDFGIILSFNTYDNSVHHNNFINNGLQAIDNGVTNQWDNGVEGNYWSDYKGKDMDHDGIGDTPYAIGGVAGSMDNYPLMKPF
jgi:parallel beta-helix repeat protein